MDLCVLNKKKRKVDYSFEPCHTDSLSAQLEVQMAAQRLQAH